MRGFVEHEHGVVRRLEARCREVGRHVGLIRPGDAGLVERDGIEQLGAACRSSGWTTQIAGDADRVADTFMILAGTTQANGPSARALRNANVELPRTPESLVVQKVTLRGKPALVVCGADDHSSLGEPPVLITHFSGCLINGRVERVEFLDSVTGELLLSSRRKLRGHGRELKDTVPR